MNNSPVPGHCGRIALKDALSTAAGQRNTDKLGQLLDITPTNHLNTAFRTQDDRWNLMAGLSQSASGQSMVHQGIIGDLASRPGFLNTQSLKDKALEVAVRCNAGTAASALIAQGADPHHGGDQLKKIAQSHNSDMVARLDPGSDSPNRTQGSSSQGGQDPASDAAKSGYLSAAGNAWLEKGAGSGAGLKTSDLVTSASGAPPNTFAALGHTLHLIKHSATNQAKQITADQSEQQRLAGFSPNQDL